MSDIVSRPYHPDPDKACEACVFGRGQHAEWCHVTPRFYVRTDPILAARLLHDIEHRRDHVDRMRVQR